MLCINAKLCEGLLLTAIFSLYSMSLVCWITSDQDRLGGGGGGRRSGIGGPGPAKVLFKEENQLLFRV